MPNDVPGYLSRKMLGTVLPAGGQTGDPILEIRRNRTNAWYRPDSVAMPDFSTIFAVSSSAIWCNLFVILTFDCVMDAFQLRNAMCVL
jgi:lipid-binding SYLF domain-containing protein